MGDMTACDIVLPDACEVGKRSLRPTGGQFASKRSFAFAAPEKRLNM